MHMFIISPPINFYYEAYVKTHFRPFAALLVMALTMLACSSFEILEIPLPVSDQVNTPTRTSIVPEEVPPHTFFYLGTDAAPARASQLLPRWPRQVGYGLCRMSSAERNSSNLLSDCACILRAIDRQIQAGRAHGFRL